MLQAATAPQALSANGRDEALCRQPRPAEGRQASTRLQDVNIDLPKISQRTRAQEKAGNETLGKPVSPAQLLYAKKIAQRKSTSSGGGQANSAAMSEWINFESKRGGGKSGRKTAYKATGSVAPTMSFEDEVTAVGNCKPFQR